MTFTFGTVLHRAGIEPAEALAIRHAYVREHEDTGRPGIRADSSDAEILQYTSEQSARTRRFPAFPPRIWIVFLPEGGKRARFWSVVENHGETSNDGTMRMFDLVATEQLADFRDRLVIDWPSPRKWHIKGTTAADYPVTGIPEA